MKKVLLTILACAAVLTSCQKEVVLVNAINLNQTTATVVEEGTVQLSATVLPDNAENKTLAWSSDNPAVATVNAQGLVTAVKAGTAKITAAATDESGVKSSCTIEVTAKAIPVTQIDLQYTSYKLKVGETLSNPATVKPDDATTKTVAYSSDKTDVASVDEEGLITAKAAGTAKIKASATDGSGVVSAECEITVIAPKDIILDVPYAVMKVNPSCKAITIKAYYGSFDNWADREDVTGATWESSNTGVVTVANGKLTAVSAGTADVTVTDADGNTAKCAVTVLPNTNKPADIYPGVMIADCQLTVQASADDQLATGPWSAKKSTLTNADGYVSGTKCIENSNCQNYRLFNYYNPDKAVDVSSVQNPALYIRLWVEDITKVNWGVDGEIEISSEGSAAYNGAEEINWKLSDVFSNATGATGKGKQALHNGWNNIVLPFDACTSKIGELRKNHINFFRIYQSTGSLIKGGNLKLDQVRVINWKEFAPCEDYQMWYDGNTVPQRQFIQDKEDKKQGESSMGIKNYWWSGADAIRLKFWSGREYAVPFDMDKSNSVVKFWLYTNKPDFLNAQQLNFELSSDNTINNVIDCTIPAGSLKLKEGWNEVTLDLSTANCIISGSGDLRKITWLRFILQFTNNVKPTMLDLKFDDIRIEKK